MATDAGIGSGTLVTAPFSAEQVLRLNLYQAEGKMHPFTCVQPHDLDRSLVATLGGWVCPKCDFTQDWAHAFMAGWPASAIGRDGPVGAVRYG